MRDTFTPGSDGVYLAEGAVPPHDNVVTERISYRATSDLSQGSRKATEKVPRLCRLLTRGRRTTVFSAKNYRLARRLPREREQAKLTGWLHFLPRLSTHEHFTKCGRAAVELLIRTTAIPPEPFVATSYVSVFSRSHRKTRPRSFRRE